MLAVDLQGKPRQFAHIVFAQAEDALAAFQSANRERFSMMDNYLNVDMAPGINGLTVDPNRQLQFRRFFGDERMLRDALTTKLDPHVERISCELMVNVS